MTTIRAIAFSVLASATVGCAPGAEAIPPCEGQLQASITNAAGSGFDTREEAAIAALESVFDVDVGRVVLAPAGGRHFLVVAADLTVLERPPRVAVQRSGTGFLSDGLSC